MSKNTADIPVLSLRSISKSYDGHPVLTGLSMDFFSGTAYCLMAPSGSGKTTLFRLILGLESPDRGEILFGKDDPDSQLPTDSEAPDRKAAVSRIFPSAPVPKNFRHGSHGRPQVSAVFQEDRLLEGFSAVENLFFALGNRYSKETLTTSLLRLLPADALEKPVCEFSGGMKRRLSVLRALLSPAEIILMDEPFTGLDPATKQTVIDLINELCSGKLLIASTHAKEDAVLLNAKIILL